MMRFFEEATKPGTYKIYYVLYDYIVDKDDDSWKLEEGQRRFYTKKEMKNYVKWIDKMDRIENITIFKQKIKYFDFKPWKKK